MGIEDSREDIVSRSIEMIRSVRSNSKFDSTLLDEVFISRDDAEAAIHAVRESPDLAVAIHEFGSRVWAEPGQELLGLEFLRQAVRHGSTGALAALGDALNWFGAHEEAVGVLRQAIEMESGDRAFNAGLLGQSLYALDKDDCEVEDLLREGAADHWEFRLDLAKLLRKDGDLLEARDILFPLVEQGVFGAAIVLGNLLGDDFGDFDAARWAYLQGVDSGDSHSAYNLGVLFFKMGDLAEAERFFSLAREMGDLSEPPDLLEPGDSGEEPEVS